MPNKNGNQDSDDPRLEGLLTGFSAIGAGIAIWSADKTLQYSNPAYLERFLGSNTNLGIEFDNHLRKLVRSGALMLIQSEGEWIEQEKANVKALASSEYVFGDGLVFTTERWEIPGGGFVEVSRDVTKEKRTARSLIKAQEEAESSDKAKSRFLRAANHDLRQPLASLKILIYNCMAAEDDEHRADLLHAMDISVSIMEDLLGALLNIGQLDAGKVSPRITTFQLSSLLERLEVQYGHQARDKGLKFKLVPSKYAIVSDRALLERIVSNLVSNAISYTETGGILVGCRRDGKDIRIEVRDSGCGIAGEHQTDIFEEFFRVADNQIHQKHSLGLGLNISNRLANVLGHPLIVKSEPNQGSIFSVKVPMGDIWYSNIGEPEINERIGGEFLGMSALVLEDDENLREALTELLERWGINVSSFTAFDDITTSFNNLEIQPDFIITDYRLKGGVEGPNVVKQVRELLEAPCPAIVVTADTNPQLLDQIRSDGFPVLIKPVSPPSLRVMMHNTLYEPELVHELNPDREQS